MPFINVNTDAVVEYTNKLEKLNRSALPVAIRQTLNNTVRDVKTRSLLTVTRQEFTIRQKNFFRAFSGFIPAKGFDVKSMIAIVGIMPKGNGAAGDLDKQEFGGMIGGRSFIPTNLARVGGSMTKKISRQKALSNFKNMPKIAFGNKNKLRKVVSKLGKGDAYVYGGMVFRVTKLARSGGAFKFNNEKIFTYKSGRSAKIDNATHFMMKSSMISRRKMVNLYKTEADRQINRVMKR